MKLKTTEKQTERLILDWLKYNNIFCWKQNNTGVFDPARKRFRLNPQMMLGVPDILCIYKGLAIGIEVKSITGKMSDHQKTFSERMTKAGGYYLLAKELDVVINFFKWIDNNIRKID